MTVIRICEGHQKTISCASDLVLDIVTASYGRHKQLSWCGWSPTSFCHAPKSLDIVRSQCQLKQSCSLYASSGVFGDPCHGINKYIKIEYNCIKAPSTAAGTTILSGTDQLSTATKVQSSSPSNQGTIGSLFSAFATESSNSTTEYGDLHTKSAPNTLDPTAIAITLPITLLVALMLIISLIILVRRRKSKRATKPSGPLNTTSASDNRRATAAEPIPVTCAQNLGNAQYITPETVPGGHDYEEPDIRPSFSTPRLAEAPGYQAVTPLPGNAATYAKYDVTNAGKSPTYTNNTSATQTAGLYEEPNSSSRAGRSRLQESSAVGMLPDSNPAYTDYDDTARPDHNAYEAVL